MGLTGLVIDYSDFTRAGEIYGLSSVIISSTFYLLWKYHDSDQRVSNLTNVHDRPLVHSAFCNNIRHVSQRRFMVPGKLSNESCSSLTCLQYECII